MQTREAYEQLEKVILAPYASHSGASQGRVYFEEEHPFRTRFQRDRDRIIHSKAFRRLEYKTQVFVNHEGDHYRTRLTHSLEAAQISRSIARMLRLNEDLAEAIALSHDLGHPPFGHSGEAEMNALMQDHGGFEHNRQSFRIVTFLERSYADFPGLNLSHEVLEGICKHVKTLDLPEGKIFQREGSFSLEAQTVNLADEIAYNNHDLDDGLRSQMISFKQLEEVALWREHYSEVVKRYPTHSESFQAQTTVRNIINFLVNDLVHQTHQHLLEKKISNLEDVKSRGDGIVSFSDPVREKTKELKKFLFTNLYRHYRVERMADKGNRIIRDLFKTYLENPRILPQEIYLKNPQEDS
ncbi:MAG: deoxyguanosinetriphosphate triphosphohydrolase, partial [Deltaproteobacteria bacterium]|nr:deoxyguanosinetriphosphate triphosphohydrolase [Deltaproteobacteria bacterium]